ncbi:MAG: GGDEF domain-containing protein [Rhodococcus sp. (in: high G+C Gram-positive bacteria)]
MRLFDKVLHPESVHGIAGLRTRLLMQFLCATTFLYGAGVVATVLPHGDRVTADITGGVIALCLGVIGVLMLWMRPRTTAGHGVALAAAMLATPAVMAFHVLTAAQFPCLIAAMFLAMYIRAFHRDRDARILVGILVALVLLAVLRSPAPVYPITYLIFAVAVFAAAETFGTVTKALIAASCTDPLTGVFNRAGWEIATADAVTGLRARGEDASTVPVTVAIVDVDDFKTVNDTDGHRAGDELLVGLAATWAQSAPEGAVIARVGGDEFAALLTEQSTAEVDEFVRATVASLPYASIGVATSTDVEEPISDVLARADAELYRAKRARFTR